MAHAAVRLAVPPAATELTARFAAIRAKLGVPETFPGEVLAAAEDAARRAAGERVEDLTDLPFVTVDPPGARDLDQAMRLARRGEGFVVDYAIADVPAFVDPAGPVAAEALRRGQTVYSPDVRTPLHPPVLSEDVASLLPDADRRAFVWRFVLDARGEVDDVDLVRATVRSRRQLDYGAVQGAADEPSGADPELAELAALLREIGTRRLTLERERGGANLPRPDQEVVADGDGYRLELRPPLPAEDWNAQLSLMTGIAAAAMMRKAGVGVLRTLPEPDHDAMGWFRRQARNLGVPWPKEVEYGAFLQTLDATRAEAPRADARGGGAVPGRGVRPVRGRAAGGFGALGRRGAVRARHRAAAPPRRPVRARGVPRGAAGRAGAGVGARGAAAAADGDGGVRPGGGRGGAAVHQHRRGRGARGAGGGDVPGRRPRRGPGRRRRPGAVAGPAGAGAVRRDRCRPAGRWRCGCWRPTSTPER